MRIHHIHRNHRNGFKAVALAAGLHSSEGEFVAIFDADFILAPDFLMKTLPHFHDPKVGMVQTRWTFCNTEHRGLPAYRRFCWDRISASNIKSGIIRTVLQLQWHCWNLASSGNRCSRRVASGYGDRGSGPELSCPTCWMAIRVS